MRQFGGQMNKQISIGQEQFTKLDKYIDTGFYGRTSKGDNSCAKISTVSIQGHKKLLLVTGARYHRIDNSMYYSFIVEPLEIYKGNTKSSIENSQGQAIPEIGLIITCKKQQYVIAEKCEVLLDLSTFKCIDDIETVKNLINKQEGYWISKSELIGVFRKGNLTFCELVERSEFGDSYYFVTYTKEHNKSVLKFIGDSKDNVLKITQKLKQKISDSITQINHEQMSLF